jgi:hypothetical protein
MPSQMSYTETLTVTTCWCGIHLAIPDNLYRWLHDAPSRACYCPLGHEFVYNKSNAAKLREERQAHQATRDLLKAEERSHSATKGQMTKLRKRVEAGVCPQCHRHFANLQRHVSTKHAAEVAT